LIEEDPMADPRIDPELDAAVRIARAMSRRRFLARGGLGMGAAVLGPSLLAACGSGGGSSGGSTGASRRSDTPPAPTGAKRLVISNWDAYIDEDRSGNPKGKGTTIAQFEAASGVGVTYRKDYNDNDEYFNKYFSPVLGKGKTLSADIVTPTYWMAARIISLGWTEAIQLDQVPNHKNLEDNYLGLKWDPKATNFMPWQSGITGIAYNPKLTGFDLKSAKDLFDDRLKGKVTFLTEMRDSVGLTMYSLGTDPSQAKVADIDAALDKLEKYTKNGHILKYTGNEYLQSLSSGDVAACAAWSGDIPQLDPSLGIKFVIPDEGGMQWFDAMVVPKGAPDNVAAAKWMNWVYDPDHAAQITEAVQYISPVKGVREALAARDEAGKKLADSPLLFPDDATKARLQVFGELAQADELAAQSRFNDITG
jgi:spermidine/putrescine transport system substrate-binding protein